MPPISKPASGFIAFSPDLPLFAGHFPGAPCVPGSLVVEALRREAERLFPALRVAEASKFRFRSFLPPGSHPYAMELDEASGLISCTVGASGPPAATGLFHVKHREDSP